MSYFFGATNLKRQTVASRPTLGVSMETAYNTVSTYSGLHWDSSGQVCLLDTAGATKLTATTTGISVAGRLTTTDGVSSGTAKVVGGLAYSNTAASTAVSNTTTETAFDTKYSMPANTLKAGTVVKIRFQGIATATNSTDTLAIKLYIGGTSGTALISMAATDVADNNVFQGEYTIICRDAGATGHIVGCGTYKSIPAAEGTMTIKDDILASTAIDTTAAQDICVSATWSVASSSNSCRLDVMTVEIL